MVKEEKWLIIQSFSAIKFKGDSEGIDSKVEDKAIEYTKSQEERVFTKGFFHSLRYLPNTYPSVLGYISGY